MLIVVHTAHHRGDGVAGILAQRLRVLGDLQRQFPGGCQYQHPGFGGKPLGLRHRGFQQRLDGRDQKRRGLAGAGLGLANQILAGKCPRQGFRLDRRAIFIANGLDRRQQTRIQIEIAELEVAGVFGVGCHTDSVFLGQS